MYWLPSIVLQLKMLKLGQESFSLWLWVMIQSCSSLIFESDIIFSFSQKIFWLLGCWVGKNHLSDFWCRIMSLLCDFHRDSTHLLYI